MSTKRKRRLGYVPGMLSLLLLPIFCLMVIDQHKPVRILRSIELLNINAGVGVTTDAPEIDGYFLPEKEYHPFVLNGDRIRNKEALSRVGILIKQIAQTGDTLNGVWIQFSEEAKYGTFIKTLELLDHENGLDLVTNSQGVFVFNRAPGDLFDNCMPSLVLLRKNLEPDWAKADEHEKERGYRFIAQNPALANISFLLYLALILFAFKRLKQQSQPC